MLPCRVSRRCTRGGQSQSPLEAALPGRHGVQPVVSQQRQQVTLQRCGLAMTVRLEPVEQCDGVDAGDPLKFGAGAQIHPSRVVTALAARRLRR